MSKFLSVIFVFATFWLMIGGDCFANSPSTSPNPLPSGMARTTNPDGSTTSTETLPDGYTRVTHYDPDGKMTDSTDYGPSGYGERKIFDEDGNQIATESVGPGPDGKERVSRRHNPDGTYTTYIYDEDGNIIDTERSDYAEKIEESNNGFTTTITKTDPETGQPIESEVLEVPPGQPSLGPRLKEKTEYGPDGRPTRTTKYDLWGNPTEIIIYDENGNVIDVRIPVQDSREPIGDETSGTFEPMDSLRGSNDGPLVTARETQTLVMQQPVQQADAKKEC